VRRYRLFVLETFSYRFRFVAGVENWLIDRYLCLRWLATTRCGIDPNIGYPTSISQFPLAYSPVFNHIPLLYSCKTFHIFIFIRFQKINLKSCSFDTPKWKLNLLAMCFSHRVARRSAVFSCCIRNLSAQTNIELQISRRPSRDDQSSCQTAIEIT
jgi:hypothetical protein